MTPAVSEMLGRFSFSVEQKREVWAAYSESPSGLVRIAQKAHAEGVRAGTTGAGLLLTMIRAGEHVLEPAVDSRPITGWRWTRGSHGETWVHDPAGRDMPPSRYSTG